MQRPTVWLAAIVASFSLVCVSPASAMKLIFDIDGTITGRDIFGTQFSLGAGAFKFDVDIIDNNQPKDPNAPAGIEGFINPFEHFNITDLPTIGLSRGGGTTNNIAAGFTNGPAPDSITISILDCVNANCGFPAGSLGNSENLGFEGLFINLDLPDSALSGGFDTILDLANFLQNLDIGNTPSFFNASYVPESLLPPLVAGVGSANGAAPDIRFVSIDGTVTQIQMIPEPWSIVLCAFALIALATYRY